MSKKKLYTKKLLRRYRLAQEANRAEEAKAQARLAQVPQKWRKHDREMEKMTEGVEW